jgi:hypothetical protein
MQTLDIKKNYETLLSLPRNKNFSSIEDSASEQELRKDIYSLGGHKALPH